MRTVTWKPKALKQLKGLRNPETERRIVKAVGKLTEFPEVANVNSLTNHVYGFRLRVGNYRVLFDDLITINVISIEEVKKRNERTY